MSELELINESPADRMGVEQLQQHIKDIIPGVSAFMDQCKAYDGSVMVWTPCIRVKCEGLTRDRLIELLSWAEGRRWHVWGNGSGYGPRYQEVFVEQRVGWGKSRRSVSDPFALLAKEEEEERSLREKQWAFGRGKKSHPRLSR